MNPRVYTTDINTPQHWQFLDPPSVLFVRI